MKRTGALYAQHVGRMIKFHWFIQGKLKVEPTTTENVLKGYGFDVVDIKELLNPPKTKERINFNNVFEKALPLDKNHPDYNIEPSFIYKDDNLLLEGLQQAKLLTNTVECESFPAEFIKLENDFQLSEQMHSEIQKKIKLCCLFEATQHKLPIKKDPLRPAWNFPRDYGITDSRKNELLCKNLVMMCEQICNKKSISVVNNAFFSIPLKAHKKKLQFEMTSETVVTRSKKLQAIADPSVTFNKTLPDLHPVDCTVGLMPDNFCKMQNIYPFSTKSKYPFIQTAFIHFNQTQVKNHFEDIVTETQIQGRSLLKGFSIAASQARALFGNDVLELPEPVVVPVIHTDGKKFHFTLYQLNTLELDNESKIKNIFWNSPRISLYDSCEYESGRPILRGYNSDVIKKIATFFSID